MTPLDLARRIVAGFLVPAVEAQDHHERWRYINRLAGLLAGYGVGAGRSALLQVMAAVPGLLAEAKPNDHATVTMLLGPNGLQKRFAECVAAVSDQPGEGWE